MSTQYLAGSTPSYRHHIRHSLVSATTPPPRKNPHRRTWLHTPSPYSFLCLPWEDCALRNGESQIGKRFKHHATRIMRNSKKPQCVSPHLLIQVFEFFSFVLFERLAVINPAIFIGKVIEII